MLISEICKALGADCRHENDDDILWLLTDSRSLTFPEQTLFFAICTRRGDGHRYIGDLYARGVRHFVISHDVDTSRMGQATFIRVDDTLKALQQLAAAHRRSFSLPVIGITGSNGKTIIKEWLFQLLRSDYRITRSPRSYNSQIGVPLSVWQISSQTELALIEAGISQPGEMGKLEPIVSPTIGIISNIGDAHQDNFDSLEQKCREKLSLFAHAELIIYNKDCPIIDLAVHESLHDGQRALTWGRTEEADIRINSIRTDEHAGLTRIEYTHDHQSAHYNLPFTDRASVENSLHCLATLIALGYEPDQVALRMMQLERVELRLDQKEGIRGCIVINDAYNSDLASLQIALDTLDRQATAGQMKRTLILSDIEGNGQPAQQLYSHVADLIRNRHIDNLIGIGQQLSAHAALFDDASSSFFATTRDFISAHPWQKWEHQVILLKGARRFHFEQIGRQLQRTQHETVLEVNLSALVQNFNYYRSLLNPQTKVCCMVKAFAYGTGAVEVAKALQHNGCDYMAVAVADEGAELRAEGIHTPVIVMAPEQEALNAIIEHNLEPNIHNFSILRSFINQAERQGLTGYPIHIKIDSGMHRLGFELNDIPELVSILKAQQAVSVRSVFSHLAGSDDPQFDDFTLEQIQRYTACADALQHGIGYKIMHHILNSAGIERFTDYQMDMVRLGIGLYGTSFIDGRQLTPVCTLRSVILQVKTVHANESIGYSRKTRLTEDRQIAVIPIGYADGLDRRLGNRAGHVIVNGHPCPIMGNICMDQTMVDVTEANAHEGDTAIIFGPGQSIDQIASQLGTINYEILTGISRRVKRIYYQE